MFVLNYWQLTSFIYFSGHAGHRTSRKSVEADQGHEDLAGIQGEQQTNHGHYQVVIIGSRPIMGINRQLLYGAEQAQALLDRGSEQSLALLDSYYMEQNNHGDYQIIVIWSRTIMGIIRQLLYGAEQSWALLDSGSEQSLALLDS